MWPRGCPRHRAFRVRAGVHCSEYSGAAHSPAQPLAQPGLAAGSLVKVQTRRTAGAAGQLQQRGPLTSWTWRDRPRSPRCLEIRKKPQQNTSNLNCPLRRDFLSWERETPQGCYLSNSGKNTPITRIAQAEIACGGVSPFH